MRTDDILDQIDAAVRDWEVGPDAMRCGAPAGSAPPTRMARPSAVTVFLTIDLTPFQEAMRKAADAIALMAPSLWKLQRALDQLEEREAARRHQPVPLRIDGREYHRRQCSRRRR